MANDFGSDHNSSACGCYKLHTGAYRRPVTFDVVFYYHLHCVSIHHLLNKYINLEFRNLIVSKNVPSLRVLFRNRSMLSSGIDKRKRSNAS